MNMNTGKETEKRAVNQKRNELSRELSSIMIKKDLTFEEIMSFIKNCELEHHEFLVARFSGIINNVLKRDNIRNKLY